MPQFKVRGPDGKTHTVNTPDGASEQDAIAFVAHTIYKVPSVEQKEAKRDALGAGFESAKSGLTVGLPLAVKKALNRLSPEDEATALTKLRESAAKQEALLPGGAPSASDVFSGKASVGRFLGENIGQMAPQVGASVLGGIAGSLVGPEGTAAGLIAPVAGGALASTPMFAGSNVERATDSGKKALTREAAVKSLAVAPLQAGAEALGERFIPGVGRIFGAPAAKAGSKFLARTGIGIAKGAAEEAITEPLQQFGERYAAGLPLTDEGARSEYTQAATTAGLLGGALGGVGAQFEGKAREDENTPPGGTKISEVPAREGFTDADITTRLTSALGDVEPDNVTSRFVNALKLKIGSDLARDDPDAANNYLLTRAANAPALRGKNYSEEQRDAQYKALEEANAIVRDYVGASQPDTGGTADATTDGTTGAPIARGRKPRVPSTGWDDTGGQPAGQPTVVEPERLGELSVAPSGNANAAGDINAALAAAPTVTPPAPIPEQAAPNFKDQAAKLIAKRTVAPVTEETAAAPIPLPEVAAPETQINEDVAVAKPSSLQEQLAYFDSIGAKGPQVQALRAQLAEETAPPTAPVAEEAAPAPATTPVEDKMRGLQQEIESVKSKISVGYKPGIVNAFKLTSKDKTFHFATFEGLEKAARKRMPTITQVPAGTAKGAYPVQRDLPSIPREQVEPDSPELTQEQINQVKALNAIKAARYAENNRITDEQAADLVSMFKPQYSTNRNFPDRIVKQPAKPSEVLAKLETYKAAQKKPGAVTAASLSNTLARIDNSPTRNISDEDHAALTKILRSRLNAMGLKDVDLGVMAKQLVEIFGGKNAIGAYTRNLVAVAYDAGNPLMTLDHESVHAMRDLGLIEDGEWKTLTTEAERRGVLKWAKDKYPDESFEIQQEEAVAEMFARWRNVKTRGPIGKLFHKIVDILRAVRGFFTDMGFQSAESLMEAMEDGTVGARARNYVGDGEAVRARNAPEDNITPNPNNPRASIVGRAASLQAGLKPFLSEWTRKLNYKYQDAIDFDEQLAATLGLEKLPDNLSNARRFELLEARKGGAQITLLKHFFLPIMKRLKELDLNPQDVGMYLWARSAADRNKMIADINGDLPEGGSGLTTAEANNVLDTLDKAGLTKKLQEIAAMHDRLVDYTLKNKVKAGLLTAEQAKALRDEQPLYASLKGFAADGDMMVPGDEFQNDANFRPERRLGLGRSEYLSATGRTTMPFNPLFNLFEDAQRAASRIETQKVGSTFLDTLQAYPTETANIAKVYTDKDPEIESRLRDPITGQTATSRKQMWLLSKEYMLVKKDGVVHYIKFLPTNEGKAMERAFSNMTPAKLNDFMSGWVSVNNTLKRLLTTRNPAYLLGPALLRDITDAVASAYAAETTKGNPAFGKKLGDRVKDYVMAPNMANAVRKYVWGVAPSNEEETRLISMLDQMVEDGGSAGHAMIKDAEAFAKDAKKKFESYKNASKTNPFEHGKQALDALTHGLDSTAEAMDLHARFATYLAAIDLKLSRDDAASLALNSSLNLTRRGEWARVLDNYAFFFSPTVEGARKLVKMGLNRGNGLKIMGTFATLGAITAINNSMMSGDDDDDGRKDYLDINDTTSMTRLVWYYGHGADDYVKIPLGFMLAYPKYVGEKIAQAGLGIASSEDASTSIMNATIEIAKGFAQATSPVRVSGENVPQNIASAIVPSILKPFSDVIINRNYFGSPIYNTQFDSSYSKASLGRENTGDIWKMLAMGLNEASGGSGNVSGSMDLQPEAYKYLVESFGGGAYKSVRDLLNVKPSDESKGMQVKDVPLARTFVGSGSEYAPINKYYDNTVKMDAFIKAARYDSDAEWAAKQRKFPLETSPEVLAAYYEVDKYKDKINDARREALDSATTPAQRKEIIDAARDMQGEVFKMYNEFYNSKRQELQK